MSSRDLDQFYTDKKVSKDCLDIFLNIVGENGVFLEPSAGGGSFVEHMVEKRIAFLAVDIDPKHPMVMREDYLSKSYKVKGVIGNPPFGKNSSLAVKFFNKASGEADYVGFILPRTFEKEFFQNKLDLNMHLVFNKVLEEESFCLDGIPYKVPCVFQVWEKRGYKRHKIKVSKVFVEEVPKDLAEYSIRRVGGKSGEVMDGVNYNESSTYFVRDVIEGSKDLIKDSFYEINKLSERTAGMKSITLKEINLYLGGKYV